MFIEILDESPLSSIRMSFNFYQNVPVYKNYKGFSSKLSFNRPIIIYSVPDLLDKTSWLLQLSCMTDQ